MRHRSTLLVIVAALISSGFAAFLCFTAGPRTPEVSRSTEEPRQLTVPVRNGTGNAHGDTELPPQADHAGQTAAVTSPSGGRLQRDRLQELEHIGYVPYDAKPDDWQLAQETTWWGKPIDPQTFWQNRVVWLDGLNTRDAHGRGRSFPPIPPDADISGLPHYEQGDIRGGRSVDDTGPSFILNPRERAFWTRWTQTHPRPVTDIEKKQREVTVSILRARHGMVHGENLARHTLESLATHELRMKERAIAWGYPTEAFSDEALLWKYVHRKRTEYENLVSEGGEQDGELSAKFRRRLYVDPDYVTRELTEEEEKKAMAWQLAYVRRLVRESVDRQYIDAYMNAWQIDDELLKEGETDHPRE